jgi:hypothetical protein
MSSESNPDNPTWTTMNRMINGFRLTQMICVAARLGLAEFMADGPQHINQLASASGAHPGALYRLLRGLAGHDIFVEVSDQTFGLTPLAELLRPGTHGSQVPHALTVMEPWWWDSWGNLLHSVQTGETAFDAVHGMGLFDYLNQHDEAAQIFNGFMTALTDAQAEAMVNAYDFGNARLVVDIAGGQGALVRAILEKYPQLQALVFDQPSVVMDASRLIREIGMEARCKVVSGNFFESVPAGGDIYMLKQIIHDWDDQDSIAILRNCRQAMTDAARLLIIERVVPPANQRGEGKLADITMLVITGGMERTEAEYHALLQASGFQLRQIIPTTTPFHLIEAIPYKMKI